MKHLLGSILNQYVAICCQFTNILLVIDFGEASHWKWRGKAQLYLIIHMWRLFKLWAWLIMEINWWLKTYVGIYYDKVSYFSFYYMYMYWQDLNAIVSKTLELRTYIDIISIFTGVFRYMKNDFLVIDNTLNDKDINIREIYCFY